MEASEGALRQPRLRDRLFGCFLHPVPEGPRAYRAAGYILKTVCWAVCLPVVFGLFASAGILLFLFVIIGLAASVGGASTHEFLSVFSEISAVIILGLVGVWLIMGGLIIYVANSIFLDWTHRRRRGLMGSRLFGAFLAIFGSLRLYWQWITRHLGDFVFNGISENLLHITVAALMVVGGAALLYISTLPEVKDQFGESTPAKRATFTRVD